VIFVVEKATPKQHAELSKQQWPLLKRITRTEVLSGRRIKLKKLKPLLQLLHLQSMKIVIVVKKMTRTKRFMKSSMASWKSFQKDNKAQKNKCKHSDNDSSDSAKNYSTSFKLVALKPKRGTVKFKLPEFFLNKTIEFKVHVDKNNVHANATDDMIIGRDLISELKLVLDFETQCISWDSIDQPMNTQGGATKRNYSLRGSLLRSDGSSQYYISR
jgi:hypothetical protein